MKSETPARRRESSRLFPILMLLGALLATTLAAFKAAGFWRRLPPVAISPSVTPFETRRDALRESMKNAPREVREGFAFQIAGQALMGAIVDKVEPDRLPVAVGNAVSGASASQIGRLEQAAARMFRLERANEPIENWAPSLRVFLEGLENANLAHFEATLISYWAGVYESLDFGAGTAYDLSSAAAGDTLGPFLQFFIERIGRVIDECDRSGDADGAEACRKIRNRLLRQWTLDPGSAGLRLLAAELLVDTLETDADAPPNIRAIAADLREWREAYRSSAAERPSAIMSPTRQPALAPTEHDRLMLRVAMTTWIAAALLVAAVVALLLALIWIFGGRGSLTERKLALKSALGAVAIVAFGVVWINLWPESIRSDFRSDFSSLQYWWLHPFVSAGITLAAVLILATPGGHTEARKGAVLPRLAGIAAGTWLLLAVALWGAAVAGEFARRDYERATRAAHEDPIAAMAGAEAQHKLNSLRDWTP